MDFHVYSLVVVDGWSRVLLSDEIVLSKGVRDVCVILLSAFAKWGVPKAILSDNAKAFTSLLYTLLLGVLRVKVYYTASGHPWENPYAKSLIGTLRAYFYPHVQRQKTPKGLQRVYREKTDYYNHRVHWGFRHDEIKTPADKLGAVKGRLLPENFSLSLLAVGKRYQRTVNGDGRISWKRYQLYVRVDLSKEKVEIREFFDTLVITYRSATLVSYECVHHNSQIESVKNTPVFHEQSGIDDSPQLELFDLSGYQLRYVYRRPPYRRNRIKADATQLVISEVLSPKSKK